MNSATPSPFANWQNFYVIVGSSAAALTGLQFVVMTLIVQARATANMRDIRAFGTPTVVHFCTALMVASLMAAPLRSRWDFSVCLGICGTAGLLYALRTVWHARKAEYNPDMEDWFWYSAVPFAAYLGLATAAILLWRGVEFSLDMVAVDTLLFLVIGIRNAWDVVTYVASKHGSAAANDKQEPKIE